jgi:puromycin-sensitive aminopeptidase
MTRRLIPAIRSKTLASVDRAALLLDAYALAKANRGPIESVVDILRAFGDNEESAVVWDSISGVLSGLYLVLESHSSEHTLAAYTSFAKKMVLSTFSKVGWDAREQDGHTDRLLRATLISLLDTFAWDDAGIISECRRRFDAHFEDPQQLPAEYRAVVYKIVLKNGGIDEYEKILKTFYATEDNAEKRFAYSLGSAKTVGL